MNFVQHLQHETQIGPHLESVGVLYIVEKSPSIGVLGGVAQSIARRQGLVMMVYQDVDAFLANFDPDASGCTVIGVLDSPEESLRCLSRICDLSKSAHSIVFAHDWDVQHIVNAIKIGATEVMDGIDDVNRFSDLLQQVLRKDNDSRMARKGRIPASLRNSLNPQEISIFELMLQGRTTKQIGAELDLSVRTIHYRKKEIFKKLGVSSRSDAIELVRLVATESTPLRLNCG